MAPVPANKSRKREPTTRAPRILNKVSRKRSLVGRSASPFSDFNCRERNVPATIRIQVNPLAPGDTGVAIARAELLTFVATLHFAPRLRPVRRLLFARSPGIQGHAAGSRRGIPFHRTGACRKTLPDRAIANPFRRSQ